MPPWMKGLTTSFLILSAGVIGITSTNLFIYWISVGTWDDELSHMISIMVGFAIVFGLMGYIYPPWSEKWKRY